MVRATKGKTICRINRHAIPILSYRLGSGSSQPGFCWQTHEVATICNSLPRGQRGRQHNNKRVEDFHSQVCNVSAANDIGTNHVIRLCHFRAAYTHTNAISYSCWWHGQEHSWKQMRANEGGCWKRVEGSGCVWWEESVMIWRWEQEAFRKNGPGWLGSFFWQG
jgi:hypothetical protein